MAITLSRYLKKLILGNATLADGSLKDVMNPSPNYMTLKVFNGSRPTNPDDVTTATPLLTMTGLQFGDADYDATIGAVVLKKNSVAWSAIPPSTGTATWFRCYVPDSGDSTGMTQDASFIYPRIDGTVGSVTGDLVMSDTTCTATVSKTIDQFNISIT